MAIIAKDINDYIDQMVLLTERLCKITQEQIDAFEVNDFEKTKPLNEEAARLGATYTVETKKIASNPNVISNADAHMKNTLKQVTKKFMELMKKHEQVLDRRRSITEGLVKAIANETVKSRPTPQAYGPKVGIKQNVNTSAITLDRKA